MKTLLFGGFLKKEKWGPTRSRKGDAEVAGARSHNLGQATPERVAGKQHPPVRDGGDIIHHRRLLSRGKRERKKNDFLNSSDGSR